MSSRLLLLVAIVALLAGAGSHGFAHAAEPSKPPSGCSIVPSLPPDPGPALEPLLAELGQLAAPSRSLTMFAAEQRIVVGVRRPTDLHRLRTMRGIHILRAEPMLRFATALVSARAARALSDLDWVRYLRLPVRMEPAVRVDDPFVSNVDPATGLPFAWQLENTRAAEALESTPGDPDFLVAIVDTGADLGHPDLVNKIACTSGDVRDVDGHGTFVAGVAAGDVGNGVGIAGFGGAARLAIVRKELFTDDALAAGIRLAADQGARVINLSFGGTEQSIPLADAVAYAARKGALIVAASGNDTSSVPFYPAVYLQPPSTQGSRSLGLSIGASNEQSARAEFSNFGDWVSLLAPGAWSAIDSCPGLGVFSTLPPQPTSFDGSACANIMSDATGARWGYGQGTSFSAPAVAGAAVLAWSVNPDLKNFQVADVLKQSAARSSGTGWNSDRGWGVLDVAAAVERARTYDSAPPGGQVRTPARVFAAPNFTVRWGGKDQGFSGHPASGIASFEVSYREAGGPLQEWLTSARPRKASFRGRIGGTYVFFLRVTDKAGNVHDASPVRIKLRRAKTRVTLENRELVVRSGDRFILRGRVIVRTPGGRSALAKRVRLNVLLSRRGPGARLLAKGRADARGRFAISVPAPSSGRHELVVELPQTVRLKTAYSPVVSLSSL